ncbi:DUF6364 family protein [Niabella soli]|uniref:Uncharacterized protein n=1 Tax=Niabella soli DSM 19437 TaxID=929713 RepID=W0EZU7_9BACT|nr:DUF6364 family protein [Niabella soli]AHF14626.1 hypothetical protein NIASO_04345 [Niabella soli DSM 19437]
MDAKVTLSFNASVIEKAKAYAASEGLSLSRLVELLLQKVIATGQHSVNIEHIPIEEWVSVVAEGPAVYNTKSLSKSQKKDFYESRK